MRVAPYIRSFAPSLLVLVSIAVTMGVYWIGLNGPFLFDDQPNFASIRDWLAGKAPLQEVLFGNTSWITHRSLAMGSFALSAWISGFTPFGFKLGNLLLHVACGVTAYMFLARLLARDPQLGHRCRLAAALIVSVWLLHPLNVSTVLYAVQRMAQWAALFTLLGLWLYVYARGRMEAFGTNKASWLTLFLAIPAITVLGIQGKQNAALLPALCLVVELAYFRKESAWPRPIVLFYCVSVFVPALVGLVALSLRPDLLLKGYGEYSFSPTERLLSEARVLCDYLRMLLAPTPPSMGVYTDDYAPSTGLLSPVSTLPSIALLMVATGAAWRARGRYPAIFCGWLLFLVGHSLEGSLLPLELYYEHRNYFPALGLFLAVAGLLAKAGSALNTAGIRSGRIGIVAGVFLVIVLAIQTHGRARVWSDPNVLAESALRNHPDSPRAVITNIGMYLDAGDYASAYKVASDTLKGTTNPRLRAQVLLFSIYIDCTAKGRSSVDMLNEAVDSLPSHIDLTTVQLFGYTAQKVEGSPPCEGISPLDLARSMSKAVDLATEQSDDAWPKWVLRYKAASLYQKAGDWDQTLAQARLSWQPSTHPARAKLLVTALVRKGEIAEAERVYLEAAARTDLDTPGAKEGLRRLRQLLLSPPSAAHPPSGPE